ncbi:MAG: Protein YchN [Anaerolineae bacterium]|nr:Protein YchN [Anaerolineae bacterium]
MNTEVTQTYLFIINDAPYGNERPFNALRLALNLVKRPGAAVRVFMTGDGVLCARKGQKTPDGYYNVERMVKSLAHRGMVAT